MLNFCLIIIGQINECRESKNIFILVKYPWYNVLNPRTCNLAIRLNFTSRCFNIYTKKFVQIIKTLIGRLIESQEIIKSRTLNLLTTINSNYKKFTGVFMKSIVAFSKVLKKHLIFFCIFIHYSQPQVIKRNRENSKKLDFHSNKDNLILSYSSNFFWLFCLK